MKRVINESKGGGRGDRKIERFQCDCGGDIKMLTSFSNGKKRHFAKCNKCGITARKPSMFP
ncbi:MAG TPA: hypothetical protein VMZ91_09150 [Candidatus Paceibacterota bacterium]|nr:hypothetical protein [Candidatus Paceibacterota bacterium]